MSAALASLVASNIFPIAEVTANGSITQLRLWDCLRGGNDGPTPSLCLVLMATTIFFPFYELTTMLHSLLGSRPAARDERSRLKHLINALRPWSMILMYMIGMLVSVSRMDTMAVMVPGVALWAMGVLIVLLAALLLVDTRDLRA